MPKTSTYLVMSAALLSLAGCNANSSSAPQRGTALPPPESTMEPEAPANPDAPTCSADKLGEFVGQSPSDAVMSRIKAIIGDKTIRTIRPGQAVTMDFRPDRLNIEIGEDGLIKSLRCT